MEEEFVKYTEALALKELGFDEPCFGFHSKIHGLIMVKTSGSSSLYKDAGECLSPTFSQAFRWLRDKYNIEVAVACFYSKRLNIPYEERQYHCHIIRDGVTSKGPKYKTYEEAELACLKKLIEIVKQK
jgi:hypothetical protein